MSVLLFCIAMIFCGREVWFFWFDDYRSSGWNTIKSHNLFVLERNNWVKNDRIMEMVLLFCMEYLSATLSNQQAKRNPTRIEFHFHWHSFSFFNTRSFSKYKLPLLTFHLKTTINNHYTQCVLHTYSVGRFSRTSSVVTVISRICYNDGNSKRIQQTTLECNNNDYI